MFTKEINASGEVEISKPVTSGLKFLVKLVSVLFTLIILLCIGVAVTGWKEHHALSLVFMPSAVILIALYKFPELLITLKPIRLILSANTITIIQGKNRTEAAWNSLETFQWDEKKSCLSAKRLPIDNKSNQQANCLFIPPSFDREDVPAILKIMSEIRSRPA